MFYNPGCPECTRIEEYIPQSEVVAPLIASGRLKVLAVYPDDDVMAWRSHLPQMPAGWTVGHAPVEHGWYGGLRPARASRLFICWTEISGCWSRIAPRILSKHGLRNTRTASNRDMSFPGLFAYLTQSRIFVRRQNGKSGISARKKCCTMRACDSALGLDRLRVYAGGVYEATASPGRGYGTGEGDLRGQGQG